MPDFQTIAEQYIAVWNETDPQARRRAIDILWATDGCYVDPMVEAYGHDQIDATIAGAQQQFAGMRFRLRGPVDAHHDQGRFTWELAPEGAAEAPIVGFDVAVCDGDGRLRAVHGFLDRVPSAA